MNSTVCFAVSAFCALALLLWLADAVLSYRQQPSTPGGLYPLRVLVLSSALFCLATGLMCLFLCRTDPRVVRSIDGSGEGRTVEDEDGNAYLVRHTWGGCFSVEWEGGTRGSRDTFFAAQGPLAEPVRDCARFSTVCAREVNPLSDAITVTRNGWWLTGGIVLFFIVAARMGLFLARREYAGLLRSAQRATTRDELLLIRRVAAERTGRPMQEFDPIIALVDRRLATLKSPVVEWSHTVPSTPGFYIAQGGGKVCVLPKLLLLHERKHGDGQEGSCLCVDNEGEREQMPTLEQYLSPARPEDLRWSARLDFRSFPWDRGS